MVLIWNVILGQILINIYLKFFCVSIDPPTTTIAPTTTAIVASKHFIIKQNESIFGEISKKKVNNSIKINKIDVCSI